MDPGGPLVVDVKAPYALICIAHMIYLIYLFVLSYVLLSSNRKCDVCLSRMLWVSAVRCSICLPLQFELEGFILTGFPLNAVVVVD